MSSFARFSEFSLDLRRRALYRGKERLHLTPKPLETLVYLVENAGRTISKQELLSSIWKDVFVTEDTLVQAVREIRRVLGDDKENPLFIQTVPRVGYRFVGEVTGESPAEERSSIRQPEAPSEPASNTPARSPSDIGTSMRWSAGWRNGALMLVLVGALFSFWLAIRDEADKTSLGTRPPDIRPTLNQHTWGVYSAFKPAVSPDGKHLLFTAIRSEEESSVDLYIMPLEGGNTLQITENADASGDMPVFTPDASHVVYAKYRSGKDGTTLPDLWIVPSFGSPPSTLIESARGAGFSVDGQWIAYTKAVAEGNPLWLSRLVQLQEHRELSGRGFNPRWSPDGKWIAYTTSDPEGGLGELWLVSSTLEDRRQLTKEPQQIYGLTWTPDSRSILFASRLGGAFHLYRIQIDAGRMVPLTIGVGDYFSPSLTPDGKTLLFTHTNPERDLVFAPDLEKPESKTVTHNEYHRWPRICPSGRLVASVIRRPDFYEHLYVTDVADGKSVKLSDQPVLHPCWMDDINVAYLQTDSRGEATDLYVVNINTRVRSFLTRFSGEASWAAIDLDRKQVAVVLQRDGVHQSILLRSLENPARNDRTVAKGSDYHCLRWVPGKSALSWSGPETSASEQNNGIWMLNLEDGRLGRLHPDGYCPVWNHDGSRLYFCRFSRMPGKSSLWEMNMQQNQIRRVRSWKQVSYYDAVGGRLIFTPVLNLSQIYSMPLE